MSVTSKVASAPPPTMLVAGNVVVAKFKAPKEPDVVTVPIGVIAAMLSSSTIRAENVGLVSLKLLKTISSPRPLFSIMRVLSDDSDAVIFVWLDT